MKDHGEGLRAMAGLVPESTAEEGDESIKMQVINLKSEILTIWQCSACPCTPSCLPWATQPSTSSLSTSREPSCQCWRQCHGTKWILGFDFILLGSFECEWTGCWLWRHTLPGKSIRGTGGRLLHTWRRYSSQSISWFLQTTNYIRYTHRLVIGTFRMLWTIVWLVLVLTKMKEFRKSKTTFLWGTMCHCWRRTLALLIWARNWSCELCHWLCFKVSFHFDFEFCNKTFVVGCKLKSRSQPKAWTAILLSKDLGELWILD